MFLALDSHEQEIAHAAADFLGNEFPLRRLHANPQDAHDLQPFSELGWLGLAAAESVGGSELGQVEEMLFFLEHGRVAGPLDVLSQVLGVAAASADTELCASLVTGQRTVALMVEQAEGQVRLLGDTDSNYAVSITADAAVLHQLAGAGFEQRACLDRSVAMSVGSAGALREIARVDGSSVWHKARIDLSAMLVGLAESALQMIVAYARERETFGRAIGAYQAVRHPCSDMAVRIEAARSQLFYAATALREAHGDAAMQVDAARLLAQKAALMNVDGNIQLHGGIGVTDEHDAHLLMKRANLLSRLCGSARSCYRSLLDMPASAEGV